MATVDSRTGKVLAGPDLVSRGFVYVRENESLMDGAQSTVEMTLNRCVEERVRDWNSVKTRMREALSSYIYRRTQAQPDDPARPDGSERVGQSLTFCVREGKRGIRHEATQMDA